jgi:hypothetical protein
MELDGEVGFDELAARLELSHDDRSAHGTGHYLPEL